MLFEKAIQPKDVSQPKRIRNMLDFDFVLAARHGNDIETAVAVFNLMSRKIRERDPPDLPLLAPRYPIEGLAHGFRVLRLDLDKDEHAVVVSNQINFAVAMPEVARDDGVAQLFEMFRGALLAPRTQLVGCLAHRLPRD